MSRQNCVQLQLGTSSGGMLRARLRFRFMEQHGGRSKITMEAQVPKLCYVLG